MLSEEIPRLMSLLPGEEHDTNRMSFGAIKGGIFDKVAMPYGKEIDAGIGENSWIVSRYATFKKARFRLLCVY